MSGMHTKESVELLGTVTIRQFEGDISEGKLISEETHKNLIVSTGKAYIASRLLSHLNSTVAGGDIIRLALGSGTTPPALNDITLQSQLDSKPFSSPPTISNSTVTFIADFPPGSATGAVSEAGLFNGKTPTPVMLNRVVFPVKNKSQYDSFQVIWAITIV